MANTTGLDVNITSMDFDLLASFVKHPPELLSRHQLIDATRDETIVIGNRAIDVHIF